MKRLAILAILLLVIAAPLSAVYAQDPGEGGFIVEGTPGVGNIGSFNPIRCSGVDCQQIFSFMFPTVIGIDAETADFTPGASASLATGWEFNEDGTELTIFLRDDYVWTDGEVIDAEDVKFTYEAIASGQAESDLTGFIDSIITEVEVVDDTTVIMRFAEADCTALNVTGYSVLPAQAFGFDGDFEGFDYSVMIDHPMDTEVPVSGGVFQYGSTVTGQSVNLIANQTYVDTEGDGVIPSGYVYTDVESFPIEVERFLAGDLNYIEVGDPTRMQEIRDSENQWFDFPSNSYTYVGFNLTDPENPQDGLDEDGNIVEQDPHPIFGDARVRQALSYAVDVEDLVANVLDGEGSAIFGTEIPTSWAINPDLEPYPFDVAQAEALLEEAGWVLDDEGTRVCDGCLYAEAGTPFEFDLITNQGNAVRESIGVIIQDQLSELGITVNFSAIDFNTVVDTILGQTHDTVIIGWSLSFPSNPDQTQIFGAAADTVGSGFNFGSWVNEEYIALNEQARTIPGCDPAERAEIYYQMQEIAQEDAPYIFLYSPTELYAAGPNVEGFAPFANQPFWNIDTWAIQN